jgi:SAM-dependent methyltransferase
MILTDDDYQIPWELLGEGRKRTDELMCVTDPWYQLRMDRTLEHIPFYSDDSLAVFDLGCGTGIYDFDIARRWPQARVLGVDINPQQIDFASGMAQKLGLSERLEFVCADLLSFVPQSHYDVVLLSDIVEHLRDPLPCLAAARVALRPRGHVIVSVPVTAESRNDWWFYRQSVGDDRFATSISPSRLDPKQPILRYWHKNYTPQEICELLAQSGFDVHKRVLCRFDVRRLRGYCPKRLRGFFNPICEGQRALKPAIDALACSLLGSAWAKTCIVVATRG